MTRCQTRFKKKSMVIVTFVFILFFWSCRSLEVMNSNWLAVSTDSHGQMEDFSKNITSHLYENGSLVGVGNDEKFLYIFYSPDIRHQTRPPSRASLTLWLDNAGKKARKYGFIYTRTHFPEGMEGARPGRPDAQPKFNDSGKRKPPAAIEPLLQFIDKANKIRTFLLTDGSQGPQIHFSSDWGDFVYAWRIPLLKETTENLYGLAAKPGQAVGIGLLWEVKPLLDSKKPEGMPGEEIDGPSGGGGKGGPPGGGMGRGGPGQGADFAEPSASRKLWLKIILAQKN